MDFVLIILLVFKNNAIIFKESIACHNHYCYTYGTISRSDENEIDKN